MPASETESERRFKAIRDKVLALTESDPISLKKAEEKADRDYSAMTPRRKQPWEEDFEATRDEILARGHARAMKIKKEIRQTGHLDLRKSAEDFDPFLVRAERYLGQVSLRKEAVRDQRLAKYSGRARDRVTLIKSLTRMNSQTPAANLRRDLRKERVGLIEDLLCVFAIRRGLA